MIESNDAMDFGARQIQRLGDDRHRRGRYVAEPILNFVQHLKQRPGAPPMRRQRDFYLLAREIIQRISDSPICIHVNSPPLDPAVLAQARA